jgi:hypothetical protein
MTKDKALRLALEALERSVATCFDPYSHEQVMSRPEHFINQAITAIKAALEAKDEPVAWRDAAIRLGEELSSVGPDSYYDMNAKEWLDWAMKQKPRGEHSLPQRTWVGLTYEDMVALQKDLFDAKGESVLPTTFAMAVEAKLKEKNT